LNRSFKVDEWRLRALFFLQRRRISPPSRVPQMGVCNIADGDTGDI
jgi:hypothetical protein